MTEMQTRKSRKMTDRQMSRQIWIDRQARSDTAGDIEKRDICAKTDYSKMKLEWGWTFFRSV